MAKNLKIPKKIGGMKIRKRYRRKLASALLYIEAAQALALLAAAASAQFGNRRRKRGKQIAG